MDITVALQVLLEGLKLLETAVGDPIKKEALSLQTDWDIELGKPYDQIDDARLDSIRGEFMRIVQLYSTAIEGQVTKT